MERGDKLGVVGNGVAHPVRCADKLLNLACHGWCFHAFEGIEVCWVVLDSLPADDAAAELDL